MREAIPLHRRYQRQGFSLLEVIIGAGFMGIIASLLFLYWRPEVGQDAVENTKRRMQLEQQEAAALEFSVKENMEPAEDIPIGKENAKPVCRIGQRNADCLDFSALIPDYLREIPLDKYEKDTVITGYFAYKNNAWEIKFCSKYLPDTYEEYCGESPADDTELN